MVKRRKLKKQAKIGILIIVIFIIALIFGIKGYQTYKYHQSYEYKLLEINYKLDETKVLISNLDNGELDNILTREYSSNIVSLVKEKYFIYRNLDRYLDYQTKNKISDYKNLVALVNVNRDRDYYEEPEATKTQQREIMLVNKYHNLDENYEPDNLVKAATSYAYANHSLNEEAYNAFKELANDAKLAGHTILINSSYRNYESQNDIWESYKASYGTKKADAYAARGGHSEHQTGYAIDVSDFYDVNDTFGDTESFIWMKENSYKYGYILRYPENKEEITGYAYEPWHYRYVGKEVAQIIYQEEITFDEYYEFYIQNKKI